MGQKGQYLFAVDLSCYKWYQSQILGGVPIKTLGSQGGGLLNIIFPLTRDTPITFTV